MTARGGCHSEALELRCVKAVPYSTINKLSWVHNGHHFCLISNVNKYKAMVLNYLIRVLTLILAVSGLIVLGYYFIAKFPNVNSTTIMWITFPDMLLFYLVYKINPRQVRRNHKVSDYWARKSLFNTARDKLYFSPVFSATSPCALRG